MNKKYVGDGEVVLISSPDRVYTDMAARFVKSERDLEDIIATPYNKNLVRKIIESGHEATTEFDWFIFGVEGYSRVTEVQLVRKRMASYMIKSGRAELDGKRSFDIVIPGNIEDFSASINISTNQLYTKNGRCIEDYLPRGQRDEVELVFNSNTLLRMIEEWYNRGVEYDIPEEDLRYLKPQATEFKALIGMNAHALRDWFRIRCCKNAQDGIRDMANKMLKLCKEDSPDLFKDAGANCKRLGYCPENKSQHSDCKGRMITKEDALGILELYNGVGDPEMIYQRKREDLDNE